MKYQLHFKANDSSSEEQELRTLLKSWNFRKLRTRKWQIDFIDSNGREIEIGINQELVGDSWLVIHKGSFSIDEFNSIVDILESKYKTEINKINAFLRTENYFISEFRGESVSYIKENENDTLTVWLNTKSISRYADRRHRSLPRAVGKFFDALGYTMEKYLKQGGIEDVGEIEDWWTGEKD